MVQPVRSSSVRRGRRRLAALAVALAALLAPLGAAPAQAVVGPPVVPTTFGHVTWSFAQATPLVQRQRITYSMDTAVQNLNAVANYSGNVSVAYDPAITTARTAYQGTVRFSSTINPGIAQHELGHWLGVGTYPGFRDHIVDGYWTGATALARVRLYDGVQARVKTNGSNFWPYGWNVPEEYVYPSRQIGLIGALRADMGLSDGTADAAGTYRIQSIGNLRLISVNATGTDVLQKSSSTTAEQRWVLTAEGGVWTIRDARDGLAIDALGQKPYSVDYGAKAAYRPATGSASQRWELQEADGGWFSLRNLATQMCLDTLQQGPGTVLRLWGCESSNPGQHWRLALE